MRNLKILIGLCASVVLFQTALGQEIDSMKIIPSSPFASDSVMFAIFSEPFSGDCSFVLEIDSTSNNNIYISGKFDSNGKCLTDGANDTINLGVYSVGNYTIHFSFIDTHGLVETDVSTLDFTVSNNTGLTKFEKKNINVYPNPCSSLLMIRNLPDISEPILLQMFNSIGQQLMVKHICNFDSEITIDMSCYESGLYYLMTEDKMLNIKVIKE